MILKKPGEDSTIVLITGARNSGKTTLCLNIVDLAHAFQLKVAGIICPKDFDDPLHPRITAINLENSEKRTFAEWDPGWDSQNLQREWKILPTASEWGNAVLGEIAQADILIIDEIGYQEFENDTGWMNAFKIVGIPSIPLSFIVIRTALLNVALKRWRITGIINLDENGHEKIESPLDRVLQFLDMIPHKK